MEKIIQHLANKIQHQDLFIDSVARIFSDEDFNDLSRRVELQLEDLISTSGKTSLKYLRRILSEMSISTWFDEDSIDYIPQRFQLLLFLIVNNNSLTDAGELLRSAGHYDLNPRSLVDATVIFALKHKLGLTQWFELYVQVEKQFQSAVLSVGSQENQTESAVREEIKLQYIRTFIQKHYSTVEGKMMTVQLTHILKENLEKTSTVSDFHDFIDRNIPYITEFRVKSRLRLMLAIENYMNKIIQEFVNLYNCYIDYRSKSDLQKLKKLVRNSVLFGQVVNEGSFKNILIGISHKNDKLSIDSFKDIRLSPSDFLLSYTQFYCQSNFFNTDKNFKGTSKKISSKKDKNLIEEESDPYGIPIITSQAVNAFRDVIFGRRDTSRSLLISILIFTGTEDIEKLNFILSDCGFDMINPERAFDLFILSVINTKNKQEFLYQLDEALEKQGRKFFLDDIDGMVEIPSKELKFKINTNRKII